MSRPLKGILLTCVAVLAFASLDSLSKYLTTFNSVLMILWVRYLAQTCLLAACSGSGPQRHARRTLENSAQSPGPRPDAHRTQLTRISPLAVGSGLS